MLKQYSFRKILFWFFVFNMLAYWLLYTRKNDINVIIYGSGITLLLLFISAVIILRGMGDEYLFIIVSMLISIGCVILYRLDDELILKQLIWIIVGVSMFLITYYTYLMFYSSWKKYSLLYLGASIVLYIITLLLAKEENGSRNWLHFGELTIQPAELIKILFIFFLASYYKIFSKDYVNVTWENIKKVDKFNILEKTKVIERLEKLNIKEKLKKVKKSKMYETISRLDKEEMLAKRRIPRKYLVLFLVYIYLGFLVLQKDWGTALEFFIIYSIMTYVFEKAIDVVILNFIFAGFGALGGYFFTSHIKIRVDTWLNPWSDVYGKGHQIAQSLFAMAAGGFFGKGIGQGNPELIPVVTTDFIFSCICEEMGILGGCAVILLYLLITYRGIKISLSVKNLFHKKIALGITSLFGIQTFIIIGGVTKLIPLTGITLPFVSYGGSSLTTSFISLGILMAVSHKSDVREDF